LRERETRAKDRSNQNNPSLQPRMEQTKGRQTVERDTEHRVTRNIGDDRVRSNKRTYATSYGMDRARQCLRGGRYIYIHSPFTVESLITTKPLRKEADGNISSESGQRPSQDGGGKLIQELRKVKNSEQSNKIEPRPENLVLQAEQPKTKIITHLPEIDISQQRQVVIYQGNVHIELSTQNTILGEWAHVTHNKRSKSGPQ
jgi:hypothetical protein